MLPNTKNTCKNAPNGNPPSELLPPNSSLRAPPSELLPPSSSRSRAHPYVEIRNWAHPNFKIRNWACPSVKIRNCGKHLKDLNKHLNQNTENTCKNAPKQASHTVFHFKRHNGGSMPVITRGPPTSRWPKQKECTAARTAALMNSLRASPDRSSEQASPESGHP